MTPKQLKQLHEDIESGRVMIVAKKDYYALEAENKQLKEAIIAYGNNPAGFDWAVLVKIDKLEQLLDDWLGYMNADETIEPPIAKTRLLLGGK